MSAKGAPVLEPPTESLASPHSPQVSTGSIVTSARLEQRMDDLMAKLSEERLARESLGEQLFAKISRVFEIVEKSAATDGNALQKGDLEGHSAKAGQELSPVAQKQAELIDRITGIEAYCESINTAQREQMVKIAAGLTAIGQELSQRLQRLEAESADQDQRLSQLQSQHAAEAGVVAEQHQVVRAQTDAMQSELQALNTMAESLGEVQALQDVDGKRIDELQQLLQFSDNRGSLNAGGAEAMVAIEDTKMRVNKCESDLSVVIEALRTKGIFDSAGRPTPRQVDSPGLESSVEITMGFVPESASSDKTSLLTDGGAPVTREVLETMMQQGGSSAGPTITTASLTASVPQSPMSFTEGSMKIRPAALMTEEPAASLKSTETQEAEVSRPVSPKSETTQKVCASSPVGTPAAVVSTGLRKDPPDVRPARSQSPPSKGASLDRGGTHSQRRASHRASMKLSPPDLALLAKAEPPGKRTTSKRTASEDREQSSPARQPSQNRQPSPNRNSSPARQRASVGTRRKNSPVRRQQSPPRPDTASGKAASGPSASLIRGSRGRKVAGSPHATPQISPHPSPGGMSQASSRSTVQEHRSQYDERASAAVATAVEEAISKAQQQREQREQQEQRDQREPPQKDSISVSTSYVTVMSGQQTPGQTPGAPSPGIASLDVRSESPNTRVIRTISAGNLPASVSAEIMTQQAARSPSAKMLRTVATGAEVRPTMIVRQESAPSANILRQESAPSATAKFINARVAGATTANVNVTPASAGPAIMRTSHIGVQPPGFFSMPISPDASFSGNISDLLTASGVQQNSAAVRTEDMHIQQSECSGKDRV